MITMKVATISPCSPKHIAKYRVQPRLFWRETAALYARYTLPYIESQGVKKIQWVGFWRNRRGA